MSSTNFLPAGEISCEDNLIPSRTAGVELHLRRKHLAAVERLDAGRTVLLMHGATFSSGSLFDAAVDGLSFMDHLARAGFDVYAVDVRGYGGSTLPPGTDAAPPVRIGTAVDDLSAAVDHVLAARGLDRLSLLAISWGGSVAGAYTAAQHDKVERLALIAPLWLTKTPPRIDPGGPLGAYREVNVREYEEAWRGAAPADARAALIPEGWFEAWLQTTLAGGPAGSLPDTLRAPTGAIQDIRDYWTTDRPYYDPADIRVPTLLVHAEWDADVTLDTVHDLFGRLRAAPYRRWVEIGAGTHMVILERNRWQVLRAVTAFLQGD